MKKSDLKGCTEALIYSAQEQSIRINYIKYNIDKTGKSPLRRMYGTRNEAISHIGSECGKLAQKEYKRRHDSVGRYVHWQFCEKLGFNSARLWYEHEPESVIENGNFKILWDFIIQCDHMIEARRPDNIVVVDKVKKETMIIDVSILGGTRVCDKERKDRKIQLVKRRNCQIIPYSPNVSFLYPLKMPENLWFSDVFRGYRNVTLGEYGLNSLNITNEIWR